MESDLIYQIRCRIIGLRPYLQHRRPIDKKENKELSNLIKILQKDATDEKAYTKEAEYYVYKNDNGYYIPSIHIKSAMIKASTNFKVGGKGNKTYKDFVKGFVVIDPKEIPINPQKYTLDRRWERVQQARIMRTRPRFDDWSAEFNLISLDETVLPMKDLKKIIVYAGKYIGIGDRRPEFGRFKVEFLDD